MVRLCAVFGVLAFALLTGLPESASTQSPDAERREWMYRQYLQLHDYVRAGEVEPHRLSDGQQVLGVLAIVGGTVIYGSDEDPLPSSVLLIRGQEIACVGDAEACPIPEGADRIDATGRWLIPRPH